MRELREYSLSDWARLAPLGAGLRQIRNDLLQARYNRLPAVDQEQFLGRVAGLRGRDIGLVIAFEQPWVVDWQLRMARRNLQRLDLLVFDNSGSGAMREQIREVCARHSVPYLALPRNTTRHVNRSHGMAMNWVYENVVRAIRPRVFGYFDHDLIPVRPNDPSKALQTQPVYGVLNESRWGWNLWAGYCLFDFDFVEHRPLNFLYDFANGLDTGGRNWGAVYASLDRSAIMLAENRFFDMADGNDFERTPVQMIDRCWFHIGSVSYNGNFDRKAALCRYLALALDEGERWEALCPGCGDAS